MTTEIGAVPIFEFLRRKHREGYPFGVPERYCGHRSHGYRRKNPGNAEKEEV